MLKKIFLGASLTSILFLHGCAFTHSALDVGRYSDRYYVKKVSADEFGNMFLLIRHQRVHVGGPEEEFESFVIATNKQDLLDRMEMKGHKSEHERKDGVKEIFYQTYCSKDYDEAWLLVTSKDDTEEHDESTHKYLSPEQIEALRKTLLTSTSISRATLEVDEEPHRFRFYCVDSHVSGKRFVGYMSDIFLLPPAFVVDAVTSPIQFAIMMHNVSKIK